MSVTLFPADFTTLTAVRAVKGYQTESVTDDPQLNSFIRMASRWISKISTRHFVPYLYAKRFGYEHIREDGLTLYLRDDLLSLTSVTDFTGAAVSGSNYNLRPDNGTPKHTIELISNGGINWNFRYREDRIIATGLWGYHENYSAAWGDSLDTTENNPLSASATSITVNDIDGSDNRGLPRFEVGDYLLIESEQAQVTALSYNDNMLTVRRGVNGTTAASHVQNTPIYVYRQMEDIRFVANEIVKWMVENRESVFQRVQVADIGILIADEMPHIKALLDQYRPDYRMIRAV